MLTHSSPSATPKSVGVDESRRPPLAKRLSARWWRRSDARSTAVLLSTSGALPLPALALMSPEFLVAGAMPYLLAVWTWTLISFTTTITMGRLSDRSFAILGFFGMIGIAVAAYIVEDPATARAIVTLLSAIPAIAAMASSPRIVFAFTFVAVTLATVVSLADATSFAAATVACAVGVIVIAIPVFMVAALRQSLERALVRAARLAEIDPLTGLFNRRGLYARTEDVLMSAAERGIRIGCAVVDVDHFKSINDRRGHACGDAVLVETVAIIDASIPSDAVVARLGGEEFVIIAPTGSAEAWNDVVETIRKEVESAENVTISAGAVTALVEIDVRGSGLSAASILDNLSATADTMLYRAKAGGRNQIVCDVAAAVRLGVRPRL